MRKLKLSKSGLNKLKSHLRELKPVDLEDSIKSLPPGDWCGLLTNGDEAWVAFVNPLIEEKYACAQVVATIKAKDLDSFDPASFIKSKISHAYKKRMRFMGYEDGARIFYGFSDGLPGLIIDYFTNATIIQINTAGVDRFRDVIKETVTALCGVEAYFLDNQKYREKEFLPVFENASVPALTVKENGLQYDMRAEVIQKVGFYYDHRENRLQLQSLLVRLHKKPQLAVDLFCYAGAWGLNALKAGVAQVEFVDQGAFDEEVHVSLKRNDFEGKGRFHRSDVFKYLDEVINEGKKFDLILCDPPAFAKSALQKSQALEGYSKLHRKVFKAAASGAICAFSSCTHYISHEEFQKNILDSAYKEGKSIQLLYCGMQGWDHPVGSLEDKANYIKSYFYILE